MRAPKALVLLLQARLTNQKKSSTGHNGCRGRGGKKVVDTELVGGHSHEKGNRWHGGKREKRGMTMARERLYLFCTATPT